MNSATVVTKTEPEVKRKAQKLARKLGVSLSALVDAYLKGIVRTKRIEFSIDEIPSEYLIKTIRQAQKNYKEGKASPVFSNAKDAIKYLEDQGI